ncbi:hypothetical protein PENTCL1PPCAC_28335, partial [Pristionchus entomophagus]
YLEEIECQVLQLGEIQSLAFADQFGQIVWFGGKGERGDEFLLFQSQVGQNVTERLRVSVQVVVATLEYRDGLERSRLEPLGEFGPRIGQHVCATNRILLPADVDVEDVIRVPG